MDETGSIDEGHTPTRAGAEADVALLFPPVRDIRIVLNLAFPIAVLVGLTVWSFVANAVTATFLLATITGAMVLISWFFFLRAATAETKPPTQLPDYRAGWSAPFRFQPEIRWQAISLSIRTVAVFIVFILPMPVLVTFLPGIDPADEVMTTIFRIYLIAFLIGMPIVIPFGALLSSRYGVDKHSRRGRDGGLPLFLIRRREAAIEALRKKWPNAVPVEANFPRRTLSGSVDDDRVHAVKAILASILTTTLGILSVITVFAFGIWLAEHRLAWDRNDAFMLPVLLTIVFGWLFNWKSLFFENQIRRRVFKIPAIETGIQCKNGPPEQESKR